MYYVIKKQENKPGTPFIGFAAPKYIASKQNENVIFLFSKDDKVIRKWVKLKDIILLTDNKEFFAKTLKEFQNTQSKLQELVDQAQKELEQSMTNFVETMNAQIHDFEEIRDSEDIPDLLKDLT